MSELPGNLSLLQQFWSESDRRQQRLDAAFDQLLSKLPEDRRLDMHLQHIRMELQEINNLKRMCLDKIRTQESQGVTRKKAGAIGSGEHKEDTGDIDMKETRD